MPPSEDQPARDKPSWRDELNRRVAERTPRSDEADTLASRFTASCPNAGVVLLYAATPNEAPTSASMQALWDAGVDVALPVVLSTERRTMEAFMVDGETQLAADRFGIFAPRLDLRTDERRIAPEQLDAVAVPGLGFDETTGNRLGRGGGYYDRFLAHCPNAKRIGFAFDEQVVRGLPAEPHDLPMHAIVTPTRTFQFT